MDDYITIPFNITTCNFHSEPPPAPVSTGGKIKDTELDRIIAEVKGELIAGVNRNAKYDNAVDGARYSMNALLRKLGGLGVIEFEDDSVHPDNTKAYHEYWEGWARRTRMGAQGPQMYELLKELSAVGHLATRSTYCRNCGMHTDVSHPGAEKLHEPDCRIAAVLKAVEGESSGS